ncbi:hypothetical protein [Rubrimonas cliftonensis]|uniref:Uncharacterized protein n=1 Tax=Rubrimonas cliftonensis TaxID=89524 RepID=A0A1H4BTP5_9RHOB|nr:hypothetical protein [Rubrimonas cliftonensis]SEA51473.1 hypothetical protein SAMN05444370_10637 [Rubrimonas cliftonensis]
MSGARSPAAVFAERLEVVLEIGAANAACHRAQAAAGGAQIAVARLEARLAGGDETAEIEAELAAAYLEDDAALAALARAEARVGALDARLAAIDADLAAAQEREAAAQGREAYLRDSAGTAPGKEQSDVL